MFEKKNAAITKAEKLLSERAKIQQAIGREVAAVSPLISALLEAQAAEETDLGRLALASEETPDETAPGESRAVAAVRSRIERQGAKLGGLRRLARDQASSFATVAKEIGQQLPAHTTQVRAAFLSEWKRATDLVGSLLSKRPAIESVVGRLELSPLPDRASALLELDEAIKTPFDVLNRVESALADIAGWTRLADQNAPQDPRLGAPPAYDPNAVYEMQVDFVGFARGAHVISIMLEPGILEMLVRTRQARAIQDAVAAQTSEAATQQIAAACAAARLPLTDPVLARPPAEIEQWRRDSEQASAENQREAARTDSERLRHHQIYPN